MKMGYMDYVHSAARLIIVRVAINISNYCRHSVEGSRNNVILGSRKRVYAQRAPGGPTVEKA
jgi:hypothetical protein